MATSGRSSWRSAAACGSTRSTAASVLDGYGVDEMSSSGRGQVLIPWPNRIQDGRYSFDGEDHQLPLDDVAEQDAIHGLVRWASWTAAGRAEDRVVDGARAASAAGLPLLAGPQHRVRCSPTKACSYGRPPPIAGRGPCPYGSGNHPYLASTEPTWIRSRCVYRRAPCCGRTSAASRSGALPVEGTDYDFRRPRSIGATVLDHAFTDLERGEDGRARVELGTRTGTRRSRSGSTRHIRT